MQTLCAVLSLKAEHYPDQPALRFGDEVHTYHNLHSTVRRVAAHLSIVGISSSSTAVLLFQNTPACVVGFLALAYLHARVMPLASDITPQALMSVYAQLPFKYVLGADPELSSLEQALGNYPYSWVDLVRLPHAALTASMEAWPAEPSAGSQAFVYHYTSGSTGAPKAVLHSQANLVAGGRIYEQTYHFSPADRILVPVPLYHSYGMVAGLIGALISGAELVLPRRCTPNQIVQALRQQRVSVLIAVPLIYNLIARCSLPEAADLDMLRLCLSSGSPLSAETARLFQDGFQLPIYQVYGSTETGVIAAQWSAERDWPELAIGYSLAGVEVRIVDGDSHDLPPNTVGDLLVKTPTLFLGYLNDHLATARKFYGDWYITGDMAKQDETGRLYLIGRKDALLRAGGRTINPFEVEAVLMSHPLVREAVVFGMTSRQVDGEPQAEVSEIQAMVVVWAPVSEEELLRFCRSRLAPFKVPNRIMFLVALPHAPLGKTLRTTFVPSNGEEEEEPPYDDGCSD